MSSLSRVYPLPNGGFTKDPDRMLEAWEDFVKPMTDYGFKLHGFDPGVSLIACGPDFQGQEYLHLSMDFMRFLHKNLRRKKNVTRRGTTVVRRSKA